MPQTADFLFFGLGVTFGALGLYALSVWWRFRNLQRDEETMNES